MTIVDVILLNWQTTPWQALVLVGLLGASVGSFLNVAIYRLPLQKSVVTPRSQCSSCGASIVWYHNIPLISYLMLRGRCGSCRARIPFSYWCIEAITALLFLVVFLLEGASGQAALWAIGGALLLAAAEIDRRHRIIPNRLVLVGLAVAGGALFLIGWEAGLHHIAAAATTTGVLLMVRWAGQRITGRIGIGMGDIKLVAVLGLFVGWPVLWIVYLAIALAACFGVGGIILKRLSRKARLPFAPFLGVAVFLHAFIVPWPGAWML